MNTRDLLNKFMYPSAGQNIRSKSQNYFDTATIVNGTNEYNLFKNSNLDYFNRNQSFPLSGNTIFFIQSINGFE